MEFQLLFKYYYDLGYLSLRMKLPHKQIFQEKFEK